MLFKPLALGVACTGLILSLGCDSSSSGKTGPFPVGEPLQSAATPLGEPLLDPLQSPAFTTDEGNSYADLSESSVDCEQRLPCHWISEDGGISVSLTAADNIAPQQRLQVDFQVQTRYDTDISLPRSLDTIGASGTRYSVTRQRLGSGNGLTPVSVLGGVRTAGWLSYHAAATDGSLAVLAMPLIDNTTRRDPVFVNVPLGPAPSTPADCEDRLPCTWVADSGEVSVTLQSVGGVSSGGRVTVNFVVETREDRQVVLDAGSLYVGVDGVGVDAISHRLGQTADYRAVVHPSFAGVPLAASLSFHRASSHSPLLKRLNIALYADAPLPRWMPAFHDVPVR